MDHKTSTVCSPAYKPNLDLLHIRQQRIGNWLDSLVVWHRSDEFWKLYYTIYALLAILNLIFVQIPSF